LASAKQLKIINFKKNYYLLIILHTASAAFAIFMLWIDSEKDGFAG
jgi:hypothetical protein